MRSFFILPIFIVCLAIAAIASPPVGAAGSDPPARTPAASDPNFTAGKQAIEKKDWQAAVDFLTAAAAKDPKSADVQNYLGYAERNRGNMDSAFQHYAKALELDPKHRGANEYVGEAYLLIDNLAKAEEHLSKLDKLCTFGCAEYTELKEKVKAYKASKKSS